VEEIAIVEVERDAHALVELDERGGEEDELDAISRRIKRVSSS